MQVFLETDRLLLRRFTAADVDLLVDLDADPDVMRYINGGRPTPRAVIQHETLPAFLSYYARFPGYGFWAAIEKATGDFLGWFHLRPAEGGAVDEPELGYRLRQPAWGKGYATEGARALVDKGFTELGVQRVVASTMAVNTASRRVLEFALDGTNALFVDPQQAGWISGQGAAPRIGPCGGRFDIGPEHLVPRRPTLWLGPWTPEVIGPAAARQHPSPGRVPGQPDDATGVQLVRDFALSPHAAHLSCTQTMRNVSPHTTRWCHWSRTFAQGGGIAIVPLSPQSRFPQGWVRYGPGPAINFRPEDPHVRRRGDFVEVLGPLQHPKLGFDSAAGWLAYRFPAPGQEVDLDAIASRVAGLA